MTEHRQHHEPQAQESEQDFWDARYRESDRVWSGNANAVLVQEAEGLPAGRVLDLGCGEGADSVWLALERAAEHAAEAGVADRIDFQRHDLGESFPSGEFDLVSACFLHSPHAGMERERILRTAAGAVAPGGILLIVGHAGWPSWKENPHPDVRFPTPEEVVAELELPQGQWEVLLCEEYERVQPMPDGRPGVRADNTVKVRRLP